LAAHVGGVNRPGQEQAGLEGRLIGDDFDQELEFHAGSIPQMAS